MAFKQEECPCTRTNHACRIFRLSRGCWTCSTEFALWRSIPRPNARPKSWNFLPVIQQRAYNNWLQTRQYMPHTQTVYRMKKHENEWHRPVHGVDRTLDAEFWTTLVISVTFQAIDITVFFALEVILQLIINAVLLSLKCHFFHHFCCLYHFKISRENFPMSYLRYAGRYFSLIHNGFLIISICHRWILSISRPRGFIEQMLEICLVYIYKRVCATGCRGQECSTVLCNGRSRRRRTLTEVFFSLHQSLQVNVLSKIRAQPLFSHHFQFIAQ